MQNIDTDGEPPGIGAVDAGTIDGDGHGSFARQRGLGRRLGVECLVVIHGHR